MSRSQPLKAVYPMQMIGVVYRDTLTTKDYDDAIQALIDARDEDTTRGCGVCSDSGHSAAQCHHNPLVIARRAVGAARVWRCYHCNAIFTDYKEAEEHFGVKGTLAPQCMI